jgi:hypothetical protein
MKDDDFKQVEAFARLRAYANGDAGAKTDVELIELIKICHPKWNNLRIIEGLNLIKSSRRKSRCWPLLFILSGFLQCSYLVL